MKLLLNHRAEKRDDCNNCLIIKPTSATGSCLCRNLSMKMYSHWVLSGFYEVNIGNLLIPNASGGHAAPVIKSDS